MTQEEKQLLLVDLCARLPYGVKVCVQSGNPWILKGIFEGEHSGIMAILLPPFSSKTVFPPTSNFAIDRIKPYLRSMSSMTEEEKKKVCFLNGISLIELNERLKWDMYIKIYTIETFDYFNAHHLDYRGLIEKGLALKAPKEMYK